MLERPKQEYKFEKEQREEPPSQIQWVSQQRKSSDEDVPQRPLMNLKTPSKELTIPTDTFGAQSTAQIGSRPATSRQENEIMIKNPQNALLSQQPSYSQYQPTKATQQNQMSFLQLNQ